MELYQTILKNILEKETIDVRFPDLHADIQEIAETECYRALQKIHAVIEDDRMDDPSCFARIEEIICIFEEIGSSCGNRHDFG